MWVGTTVENQKMADTRIPHLARIESSVRFLSMEPLLEPVSLKAGPPPDWVIVGAESGPGRRAFNEDWARSLRDRCLETNTKFFLKQMPGNTRKGVVETPELDARRWTQIPCSDGSDEGSPR